MARTKVKLQFIMNDTIRRVTYNKRVKSLLKKSEELSVLCGVDVCTIIYGIYDQTPRVWPPSATDAVSILTKKIEKFDINQSKRKFGQKEFLKQFKENTIKKILRRRRRNIEHVMENTIGDILTGKPVEEVPKEDMDILKWVIDDKLRAFQHQIRLLEGTNTNVSPVDLYDPNPNVNLNNSLFGNEMIVGSANNIPFEAYVQPFNMPQYYHQP
ncbi:hypothetical protein RND81_14G076700 [Saponaria officinalis]|uniref:MADS-box domain-containing protein n=1 Tax=Saponaria officinalis TaxID=3572 RepID=A0AAW1GTN5_SAPOF